jgi:hypothetical protein
MMTIAFATRRWQQDSRAAIAQVGQHFQTSKQFRQQLHQGERAVGCLLQSASAGARQLHDLPGHHVRPCSEEVGGFVCRPLPGHTAEPQRLCDLHGRLRVRRPAGVGGPARGGDAVGYGGAQASAADAAGKGSTDSGLFPAPALLLRAAGQLPRGHGWSSWLVLFGPKLLRLWWGLLE